MKITLPLPPNLANSRMHWRVKQKEKKAYWEACGVAWVRQIVTLRTEVVQLPAPIKVRAVIYCGGQMDHDNAIARLKWPIDWLVDSGYLVGDKPSQLEWHWPIAQVVKRDGNYRVEFELEAA